MTTEKRVFVLRSSDRPSLPLLVKALSGATFDPSEVRWAFHDGLYAISINFQRLARCATEHLINAMKFPLIWYAENTEGKTMAAEFFRVSAMLETAAAAQGGRVDVIDATLLINYRASLSADKEWRLGSLSAFLKKWHRLGVPGVTDDAVQFLKSVRLKGNRKGLAVLTMDASTGPLTDIERSAVQTALNDAFAAGKIPTEDYLLVWLCLLLGPRNVQFAMLKACDVREIVKKDGICEYVLRVPRVKQEIAEARREQFTERLIAPSIGKMLMAYSKDIRARFEDVANFSDDASQAPLFVKMDTTKINRPNFHYHMTPTEIGRKVKSVCDTLRVYSERTGKPIKITSKRLRHTVATSAAREGHGELIIAELLDHSDTQNVGVYVKATPEIVERIDRAIAIRMAPLAHAFAGTIIRNESEAIRGGDPTSRIVDPRFDETMKPMGNCGRNGSCGFLVPISCYTCKSFQAWIEGPHEAVLAHLIAERERLMTETDERVATVNDRTILAVAEVVRQVREMRGEIIDDG